MYYSSNPSSIINRHKDNLNVTKELLINYFNQMLISTIVRNWSWSFLFLTAFVSYSLSLSFFFFFFFFFLSYNLFVCLISFFCLGFSYLAKVGLVLAAMRFLSSVSFLAWVKMTRPSFSAMLLATVMPSFSALLNRPSGMCDATTAAYCCVLPSLPTSVFKSTDNDWVTFCLPAIINVTQGQSKRHHIPVDNIQLVQSGWW